jgi:hypothetical protein
MDERHPLPERTVQDELIRSDFDLLLYAIIEAKGYAAGARST